MTGKRWEGQRRWGRGRKCKRVGGGEGVEGRQAGEKFTSTVDWSRKSCNLAAARKQKQMSHVSHISHPLSLSIFLPSFLSSYPHSPDGLATIFFYPHSALISLYLSLFLYLSMSGAVWLGLMLDYSPQWADSTPPGLMLATQPASSVAADIQTAHRTLLALMRAMDWREE